MQSAPISLQCRIAPEDQTRADCYAVIARLFGAPPDAELLRALGKAEQMGGSAINSVAGAWNRLLDASAAMDADAAAQEYTDLFIGVGKCEVDLHASHWRTASMPDKPLVELRVELPALGIARRADATMLEDHLSALCETMRLLIVGDEHRRAASIDAQRNFSRKWLFPWVFACCAAIEKTSVANYYVRVAEFTNLFMALERDSLAME